MPNNIRVGNKEIDISHRVFVIGEVEPYCPDDQNQVGWYIESTGPAAYSNSCGIVLVDEKLPFAEIVSYEELKGDKPKPGNYVHTRRDLPIGGKRISIEIIRMNYNS